MLGIFLCNRGVSQNILFTNFTNTNNISNDSGFVDKQFDSILDFMRNDGRFYLGRVERESFGI